MRAGGVEVQRLRVHGDSEPLLGQLRAQQLLAAADLRSTRLPPAAVLVVRELRDPDPGRLDLARQGPDHEWEQQVRGILDDLVLRAARPALAPPAPTDPAVVFADRAEMIACAWREVRRSGRASSWWWQALRLDDLDRVSAALAAAPEQMPAVCAALDATGDLVDCVLLLPQAVAAALVEEVARVFGRPGLISQSRARIDTLRTVRDDAAPTRSGQEHRAPDVSPSAAALGLRGAPARAVLVDACATLLAPPRTQRPLRASGRGGSQPLHEVPQPSSTAGREPGRRPPSDERTRDAVDALPPRGSPAAPPRPSRRDDGAVTAGRRAGPRSEVRPAPRPGAPGRRAPGQTPVPDRPAPVPDLRHPDALDGGGAVVATSLGGLFHLVQVGQALGLYADFTSPAEPGIRCGVWDFVTLLGRGLDVGVPRDPVWRLLADLEGRGPTSPPGLGFRPPRTWRVPLAWLPPVDAPGRWRWCEEAGTAALVHPTGFAVVAGRHLERDRECARYGVRRCVAADPVHRRPPPGATARERWVHHLAAYTRVRLAAALGGPPGRAGRTLCRRRASVHVSASRIDVVSDLADLAIEVRLAGLDRDLGFVPAAARTIGFTFR